MGPVHISVVAVGRVKDPGYNLAQEEYAKRLQRYARLEIIEVDDEPVPSGRVHSGREREGVKLREGERLLRRLPPNSLSVALDSRGRQFTSEEFAAWLGRMQRDPAGCPSQRARRGQGDLTFLLGGTLGLPQMLLDQACLSLSLSSFTFPHQLARVILLEQLYRAFRILRQEPYHY